MEKAFVIVVLMIVILIGFVIFVLLQDHIYKNSECLNEIAKEICKEKGMNLNRVYWNNFECEEDFRIKDKTAYYFLKTDKEKCFGK